MTESFATGTHVSGAQRRRWVLHVDLDQFVAAVEVLRRPELSGRAVVVGGRGDPTERGVVSTASYEARALGVGSGMPLRIAARKAPDAVFLPVDKPAYDAASAVVMDALRTLEVAVEVLGWDEAFLGVDTLDPESFAATVQRTVFDASELHCSVGVGDNKLRAKIATEFGKPRGTFRLTAENWFEVMGERGTDALWGIGRKTSKKLTSMGIDTVRRLADTDDGVLAAAFGPKTGPWIGAKGRGIDISPVSSQPWVARSHSREVTFQEDESDWGVVREQVANLTRTVLDDVVKENRPAVRAALKIRYAPFETHTVSAPIAGPPTFDLQSITSAATALVDRLDHDREVRLVGVRLEMAPPTPR